MKIDAHVHSYPLLMPGATFSPFIPRISGIKLNDLARVLKQRESCSGEMHGVFYGGNDFRTLPNPPSSKYLFDRTLPMIECHKLQIIGVTSWNKRQGIAKFSEYETQIDALKSIIDAGGIAIIDQPRPIYQKKETNRVSLSHPGEATVFDLHNLDEQTKQRTFLCYSGMLFPKNRTQAKELSNLTGIALIGGSDVILNPEFIFSTYSSSNAESLPEIVENPSLIGELHEGAVPWYALERFQRISSAIIEEVMGVKTREKFHENMVRKYLS